MLFLVGAIVNLDHPTNVVLGWDKHVLCLYATLVSSVAMMLALRTTGSFPTGTLAFIFYGSKEN